MAKNEPRLKWLHISDIHVSKADPYDRNKVVDALIKSAGNLRRQGLQADVIFFTGDLAFGGSKEEYEIAGKVLDDLLAAFELGRDRLFLIPGNHDVNRMEGAGVARTLHSEAESQKYFSGAGPLLHITQRQREFVQWYDDYFKGARFYDQTNSCGPYQEVDVGGFNLGVLPINTALFSAAEDDYGKLWVGRRSLDRATAAGKGTADLVVGLMHHPVDWLHELERTQVTAKLRDFCDCILRGHLHQTEIEKVSGTAGAALHMAAGAIYQGSQWPNSATFVEVSGMGFSVRPIRYSDTPLPQWTVDPSIYPDQPNYFGFVAREGDQITADKVEVHAGFPIPVLEHAAVATADPNKEAVARAEFERDLFVGPNGRFIYVEPRLSSTAPEDVGLTANNVDFVGVDEIVNSDDGYIVYCQSEYGGTSLSKRVYRDIIRNGGASELRDALALPNYRVKLREVFAGVNLNSKNTTLILDNYDKVKHERLLKELSSLGVFSRFVLISTIRGAQIDAQPPATGEGVLVPLYLWSIGRQGIRSITQTLLDTGDEGRVSSVVEKVYTDLLALSIPLTPFNVVTYIKVLSREQDFQPFNRVDIVERYMAAALSTSSEAFSGLLTSKDRMEILSEFAYSIYQRSATYFSDIEWYQFAEKYAKETLVSFSAKELLRSIEESRIILRFADKIYFKYSFYFSFLVGRYISSRSSALALFMSGDGIFTLHGVVETISGLSSDGTMLLEHLTADLEGKVKEFSEKFIPREFDPLAEAEWQFTESDQAVWEKVNQQVEEGPVSAAELDLFRTSFRKEAQTADQQVRYYEMKALEYEVFASAAMLGQALKASHGVRAGVKKRAVVACLTTDLIGMQIGTILASEIAKRDWFQWGGAVFIGFKTFGQEEKDEVTATAAVVTTVHNAVAIKAAEDVASRKLGEVFKAVAPEFNPESYLNVLSFSCILNAKPDEWADVLERQIEKIGRRAYYLALMLQLLMRDFKSGVNKQHDRELLKRLIATIYAKRNYNKTSPGAKLVADVMKKLEADGTFLTNAVTSKSDG